MHIRRTWTLALAAAAVAVPLTATHAEDNAEAAAGPEAKAVTYGHDGVALEGYLVMPEGEVRGGVLIVHAWWGLRDYTKKRADMVAELGYAAFALDMYGKGKVTDDPKQAGQWAGALYKDRDLHRARAAAGLDAFRQAADLGDKPVVVMGYCFGGTTALELAYSGADLAAAVSFHGSPKPPAEGEAEQVKARIHIEHGAADPLVSNEQLIEATTPLEKAGVDWTLVVHSGAKHAFTDPTADDAGMDAVAYDKDADKRSWANFVRLLGEVIGGDAAAAGEQAAATAGIAEPGEPRIEIIFDANRLARFGLTVTEVGQRLRNSNDVARADADQLADLTIAVDGQAIRLGDVAEIRRVR